MVPCSLRDSITQFPHFLVHTLYVFFTARHLENKRTTEITSLAGWLAWLKQPWNVYSGSVPDVEEAKVQPRYPYLHQDVRRIKEAAKVYIPQYTLDHAFQVATYSRGYDNCIVLRHSLSKL